MSHRLLLPFLAAAALTVSGCGSDDEATPDAPQSAAASTPAPVETQDTEDGGLTPGSDSPVPDDAPAADPSAAITLSGKIKIKAKDMTFSPASITTKKGPLKITLVNNGSMPHELVVLRTSQLSPDLKVKNKKVSEKNSIGEISGVAPGKEKTKTFDLKPGHYVIVCNIPGHYSAGMRGDIVVDGGGA